MTLRLTLAAVAAAVAAGGAAAWAVGSDPPRHGPSAVQVGPTRAQQAVRVRLAQELATYGCSCGGHRPPPAAQQTP